MLRHTGFVTTALGLVLIGPNAASELLGQDAAQRDPLTQAWFDTVQSIGTLEGLSTQLESGRPGAVQNLLRNTEVPLGDTSLRQQRIDELSIEIDRMRSELDVLRTTVTRSQPGTAAQAAGQPPAPAAQPHTPRIEAATVGMTSAERRALLGGREAEPADDVAAALAAARQRVLEQAAGQRPATGDPAPVGVTTAPRPTGLPAPIEAQPGITPEQPSQSGSPADAIQDTGSQRTPGPGRAPSDLEVIERMPTTLVMGPTGDASIPVVPTVRPPAATNGASSPVIPVTQAPLGTVEVDAGTAPIADRIAAAQANIDATAAAELQSRVAGAYSADTVLQGRAAYFAGDYDRALAALAPITQDPRAVYWTGRTYEKLERASDAMRCYESVIAMPEAGDLVARAQLDLDFLQWKWEHSEGFDAIRKSTGTTGSADR